MKLRGALKLGVLSLGFLCLLVPSASASIIGHLSVTNCAGGGVTVSLSLINWEVGSPSACVQTGIGTTVHSNIGPLVIPTNGTINDLPPASGIFGFMTFGPLLFDLEPVNGFPTVNTTTCGVVAPSNGQSCSIVNSPFVLTTIEANGTVSTSVSLRAQGTVADPNGGPLSQWRGSFTTQINDQTPAQIRLTILAGGSISSSFSGEFDVTPVPEPVSAGLIGGSLIALAMFKRRKLT